MIHVNRRTVSPPKSLTDPEGPGVKETQRAIVFYHDPANRDKPFPFKAYGEAEVKKCLNELFHYKCAYCESYFGATQPVDIEHFRPKSAVLVGDQLRKPGYYWLAAKWENLLPSCSDCNRPRTQEVGNQKPQVQGKANQFPISNEASRAESPGQEDREQRLLLDPCLDNPDKHLVFEVEGEDEVVVRPAKLTKGKESRIGQESIRVYALQRSGLAQARRDRFKLIKAQLVRINRYIRRLDQNPDDQEIQQWLTDEMKELDRLLKEDQPYVGMARQYVKQILG